MLGGGPLDHLWKHKKRAFFPKKTSVCVCLLLTCVVTNEELLKGFKTK